MTALRRERFVALNDKGEAARLADVSQIGADTFTVKVGERELAVRVLKRDAHGRLLDLDVAGRFMRVAATLDAEGEADIMVGGEEWAGTFVSERQLKMRAHAAAGGKSGRFTVKAPMPGRVSRVMVKPGDAVKSGQGVVAVEAMKMENELRCGIDGVVTEVRAKAGDNVDRNAVLVIIDPVQS
jgi:biotin carboxyl carrier protein